MPADLATMRARLDQDATVTVIYAEPVAVAVVRVVECVKEGRAGGFTSLSAEVEVGGAWRAVPGTPSLGGPSGSVLEFALDEPVQASAVRVTGRVGSGVSLAEIDALAAE